MENFYFILVMLFTYVSTVDVVADQGRRFFLIEAVKQEKTDIINWLIDLEANLDVQDTQGKSPLMFAASLQSSDIVRSLIENGASLELTDHSGKTALHYAAGSGQTDVVKYLYDLDLNMTAADLNGKTSLHLASEGGHLDTVIFLLDEGEDPYVTDYENLTSIHIAAAHGHVPVLSVFINRSINIDVSDYANGTTPLMLAAMYNETDTAKYLVESGANVNSSNKLLWTMVHAASHSGSINLIEYFLERNLSLEQIDIYGRTPLYIAVERGIFPLAKYLVQRGSNLHSIDIFGNTLMHVAAQSGNLKLIIFLVGKKLLLDVKNKVGSTPLLFACEKGHLHVIEYLMKYKCNINVVNNDGMSAIHAAVISGNIALVNFLVDKGLSLTRKDIMSRTPLHLASMHGHLQIVELLVESMSHRHDSSNHPFSTFGMGSRECVKCLVTRVNSKDKNGKTCTYLAAEYGMLDVLKFLTENGGNHTINDDVGKSPFHAATRSGEVDILKFLILQNVDINLQDILGQTPIFDAVETGQWDSFTFLINNGADPKIKDNVERTLIHVAAEKGHNNILNFLLLSKEMTHLIDFSGKLIKTPSWYAARFGHLNCLSNLLSAGAIINRDVLYAAVDNGQIETLKYLIWNIDNLNIKKTISFPMILEYALLKNSSVDLLAYIFHFSASNSSHSQIEDFLKMFLRSGKINLLESLMSQETINLTDYCLNLLFDQVKQNQTLGLRYLLNRGCKPDQRFPFLNNRTLLQIASSNGNIEVLDLLISHGLDKDLKDGINNTVFSEAVERDDVNVIEYLLKNKSNDSFRQTDLYYFLKLAANNGSLGVIKYFFTSFKLDSDHVYDNGETLLHFAVRSDNPLLVSYLIDSGVEMEKKDSNGDLPIHIAVNYFHSLRVLLENGASTGLSGSKRKTPLQLAYDSDNFAAFKCLLKFGASSELNTRSDRRKLNSLMDEVRYYNSRRQKLSCEENDLKTDYYTSEY